MSKEIDDYVNAQVANGVPRADILASFAKSSDAELKKYAGVPEEKKPTETAAPAAAQSTLDQYLGIAKDLIKGYEAPVAVAGTGAAAYAAYKAGQKNAVPPPPPPISAYELSMQEAALRKANADAAIAEAKLQKFSGVQPTAEQMKQPVGQTNLTLEDVVNRKKTLPTAVEQAAPTPAEKLVGTTAATVDPVDPNPPKAVDLPPLQSPAPELTPVAKAAAMLESPDDLSSKAPEITGKTGAAVSPKTRAAKTTITYKDTPQTWQKLTKEGTTFLPGYGPGDNNLFNTYGAEGRKAILEQFNNGKPIGGYKNYEELNKKIAKGVAIGDVPDLMKKLPSEAEAGNYGKLGKALKVGGIAGLGLSLSELANAKSIPEFLLRSGDIATDYIPGIGQFKQGMSGGTLSSGTLDSPEARELFKRAKPTGAVPPPR